MKLEDFKKSIDLTTRLLKGQVKSHMRRTKAGQVIQVHEHLRKPSPSRSKDEAESPGRNFKYKVTRQFTGGPLEGMVHTEITTAAMREGTEVKKPVGGSPYKILKVEKVPDRPTPDKNPPFSIVDKATGKGRFYDYDSGEEIHGYEGPFYLNGNKDSVLYTWMEDGERNYGIKPRK